MSDEIWYPYRILILDQEEMEDTYRRLLESDYGVVALRSPTDRLYYLYVMDAEEIDGIVRLMEDEDVDYDLQEWDMGPE